MGTGDIQALMSHLGSHKHSQHPLPGAVPMGCRQGSPNPLPPAPFAPQAQGEMPSPAPSVPPLRQSRGPMGTGASALWTQPIHGPLPPRQGPPQPSSRATGVPAHPPFRCPKQPQPVPGTLAAPSTQREGVICPGHIPHIPPPPFPLGPAPSIPPPAPAGPKATGRVPPAALPGEPTGAAPKRRGERVGGTSGGLQSPAGRGQRRSVMPGPQRAEDWCCCYR